LFTDLDFISFFNYCFSEVLCQEALQTTIGNNLLWSTSRDTQEGIQGEFLFLFFSFLNNISFKNHLANTLLNANLFPCFCIIAHHGSQQTVQLKLDRYTGKKNFKIKQFGFFFQFRS